MRLSVRVLRGALAAFCLIVVVALVILYLRFGGAGSEFPDLTTPPLLPSSALEKVADLPEPPGNIAVASDGRIFFTFHAESHPDIKVLELVNGKPEPFPNLDFQTFHKDRPSFGEVFSLRIDGSGRLWTLDHGMHGLYRPRLLAFDLSTRALVHEYAFPPEIAGFGSFLQDFQIAPEGRHIYLADTGVLAKEPAIILYDISAKRSFRLLGGHASLLPEPYVIRARDHEMQLLGGLFWMHPGLDPIAIDRRGEWLYFGPMSGNSLFRAKVSELWSHANGGDLPNIERYADKPQCDGLTIDQEDTIYVTGIEQGAIFTIDRARRLQTLVKHPDLRWPDGFSFGPQGVLYVTDSALQDTMMRTPWHRKSAAPYSIWRVHLGVTATPGQ